MDSTSSTAEISLQRIKTNFEKSRISENIRKLENGRGVHPSVTNPTRHTNLA